MASQPSAVTKARTLRKVDVRIELEAPREGLMEVDVPTRARFVDRVQALIQATASLRREWRTILNWRPPQTAETMRPRRADLWAMKWMIGGYLIPSRVPSHPRVHLYIVPHRTKEEKRVKHRVSDARIQPPTEIERSRSIQRLDLT